MKRRLLRLLGALVLLSLGFVGGVLALRSLIQAGNRSAGAIVAPYGIDEARYITIGGVRQWVTIRGQDRRKPILLSLHGGPGSAISDIIYFAARPWEDEFVVVQWDQRGAGRSAIDAEAAKGTMTLDRHVADTVELLTWLNKRFDRRVVLVGQSWGSLLGAEVAHRRPDLISIYVAIAQVTAWEENFEEARRLLLDQAKRTGDTALATRMQALGPQPRAATDPEGQSKWLGAVAQDVGKYGHSWHNSTVPGWRSPLITALIGSPTMSTGDIIGMATGGYGYEKDLKPQLIRSISGWHIERNVGTDFKVPVVMMMGRQDWQTPVTLAERYFATICAPWKAWVEFPYSAHIVFAEEPGRFQRAFVDLVVPAANGEVPAGVTTCPA